MVDVVIVTDSKHGLIPLLGCLDLLSLLYSDVRLNDLNRYLECKNMPSLLLFRATLDTDADLFSHNLRDDAAALPVALLVDTMQQDTEKYALNAGFNGVLSLNMPLPQMLKALSVLSNAGLWYSRSAVEQLVSKQLQKRRLQAKKNILTTFTQKERLIAQLSAEGLANREIASRLHLSPYTVKTHMQRIFSKANINNRLQLSAILNNCNLE